MSTGILGFTFHFPVNHPVDQEMPVSRRKSCQHCRRAKARCNLARSCSRCIDRGLDCKYTEFFGTSHGNTQFTSIENGSEAMTNDDIDIGWPSLDWSESSLLPLFAGDNTGASPTSVMDLIDDAQTAALPPNRVFPDPMCFPTPSSADQDDGTVVLYGAVYHNFLGLKPQTSLTGHLLWGQLKSYPFLLLQGQLPPFIYPSCVLNDQLPKNCISRGIHRCLPKPLAICVSLVGMFETRTPTNSPALWKMIYSEVHRLQCSFQTYSPDNVLAAFQAVTIYLLLQAQDLTCRSQNDVGSLVVTIVEVASYLGQIQGQSHCQDPFTQENLTQSEWVFNESIRRTAHVFYLLESILLEAIIGSNDPKGCGGFDLVPLSGPHMLWDYHTTEAWAWRLERFKSKGSSLQLTISDLRAAGRGESIQGISTWCESVDEFGGLLWISTLLG